MTDLNSAFDASRRQQREMPRRAAWSLWYIAMLVVLLALLWRTTSIAIADFTWEIAPQVALFVDPSFSKARQTDALLKLADATKDSREAEEALKDILRRDPIAPGVITSIAKIYMAQKQPDKAAKLWAIAASATWRDGNAQTEALQLALKAQDYTRAIDHFDALMRVYYNKTELVVAQIASSLEITPLRTELIARLVQNPPWRAQFLSNLGRISISIATVNQIYGSLLRSPSPLTADELRPYLLRLVANKFYENAYLIWLSSLPKSMKPDGDLLYNHDFQFPVSQMPFDWTFDPTPGVDIDVERKSFTRNLRVTFSYTRSRFQNVRQLLLLAPGAYKFTGRESADMLANERGVRWRIRCLSDLDGALGVSSLLMDTVPWRDFKVEFSVPRSCPVQEILLEIPARAPGEQNASGSVAYSDFSLQPVVPTVAQ